MTGGSSSPDLPAFSALDLGLRFDPERLAGDLDTIPPDAWIAHVNARGYEGSWQAVALRAPADAVHPVQMVTAHPGVQAFVDTEVLSRCPSFRSVTSALHCPLLSVRLLRLGPGSAILPHRDPQLAPGDGVLRLHVPVRTHADVVFRLAGRRVTMQAGELWACDFTQEHAVENPGPGERVHLVADCVVNDWLAARIREATQH